MSGDERQSLTGWGHRLREENRGLKEKIAGLRKESGVLHRELQGVWRLFEHIPGGLILVQPKQILFANDAVLRWAGYTRDELLAMEPFELLGSGSIAFGAPRRKGSGRDQASGPDETTLTTKEGGPLPVEVRTQQTPYKGKPTFLIHIIPLDERQARERRRMQSERSEAFLAMALGFRRELEACARLLREGLSSSLRTEAQKDVATRILNHMEETREKEVVLTRQLQCLAKTDYEPSELGVVNLKGLLDAAIDLARQEAGKGCRYKADSIVIKIFVRAPSEIVGCGRDLEEAFSHLILNAMEALPDGGDIYLTTEDHGGVAHVYVQDNGIGMSRAVVERMFDPFFTTKEGNWRGLGLPLTHAIIDRHQGDISVTSEAGRGSTFLVKLPLIRLAFQARTSPHRRGLRHSNILIVGNDGALTDILRTLFTGKAGAVSVTSSYGESLRLLREVDVHLVIADPSALHQNTGRVISRMKGLQPGLAVVLINTQRERDSLKPRRDTDPDLTIARPLDLNRFLAQVTMLMEAGGTPL